MGRLHVATALLLAACSGGADSASVPADTADTAVPIRTPFSAASGTEHLEYAGWLAEPGLRDCDMRWTVTAAPAAGCPSCEYGFDARFVLDEAGSTDDGSCAVVHLDRERTLAYTTDWQGLGPAIATLEGGRWYWWAYAETTDAGLHWWFGWEDLDPPPPADGPDTHEGLYLTNLWDTEMSW